MADDVLSQEEIDALLTGAGSGEASAEPALAPQKPGGVRPYRLGSQDRGVHGRMPALERINERFARLLQPGLSSFLHRSVTASMATPRIIKYAEFLRGLATPANLNLASLQPLRGTGLFAFEPALVFRIIDSLFGGDGRFHARVEGRDFTVTEQRIVAKLLQIVFQCYESSWERVHALHFEFRRTETHTESVPIAKPEDFVVVSTFEIKLGEHGGCFHICIPYRSLQPIRGLLERPPQGDQAEPDPRWAQKLQAQLQAAEVEIVAHLTATTVRFSDLLKMGVGDVLPIELPTMVEASSDGVPIMQCRYGEINGHYALRVERLLGPNKEEGHAPSRA